jgi:wobble nucleotide-excising tRNase
MNEFEALKQFRAELTARGIISDQGRMEVQLLGLAEKLAEKVKHLESQIAEKVKEHETRIKEFEQQIPKPSSTQGVVKKRTTRHR